MYYLYKKSFSTLNEKIPFVVQFFYPNPAFTFVSGEKRSLKTYILRLYFWLITFGKITLFFVKNDDGEIMHLSYVLSRNFKFPFMERDCLEIGPCITNEKYRKMGLYTTVLRFITGFSGYKQKSFYMLVHKDNFASIKGIENSGFVRIGSLKKTKYLKVYKKNEN